MHIAMTLAHETAVLAPAEYRVQAITGRCTPCLQVFQLRCALTRRQALAYLLEVFLNRMTHRCGFAVTAILARYRDGFVEAGYQPCNRVQLPWLQFTPAQYTVELRVLGKLQHAHRVFNGIALATEHRLFRCTGYRQHIEVGIRRQAPVQAQLFFAVETALVECGEIEKTEINRLLDLVGIVTGQYHP